MLVRELALDDAGRSCS